MISIEPADHDGTRTVTEYRLPRKAPDSLEVVLDAVAITPRQWDTICRLVERQREV